VELERAQAERKKGTRRAYCASVYFSTGKLDMFVNIQVLNRQ
jgi:hypothetical protein